MRTFILGSLLLALLLWGLFVGGASLSPSEVGAALVAPVGLAQSPANFITIVWDLRIPRMVAAFCVGAALALAGALSQALFRNPLADPFILGTSAGASFGITLAFLFNLTYLAPGWLAMPPFAFLGSIVVTAMVVIIGRKGSALPVNTLLLAGVAANYLFVSLSTAIMAFGREILNRTVFWSLEGLAGANWTSVWTILPGLLVASVAALFLAKPLNLLLLGEESALGLGLSVPSVKWVIVGLISLLTGVAVSISGLIGFVGLMVPHISRLLVGAHHRRLLPVCFLCGGMLLLGADNLARSILPGSEIPVSVITALLGVPFFIYLLRKK